MGTGGVRTTGEAEEGSSSFLTSVQAARAQLPGGFLKFPRLLRFLKFFKSTLDSFKERLEVFSTVRPRMLQVRQFLLSQ